MNAIELLEQQHEEVLELFEKLAESSAGEDRKATFKILQQNLLGHMVIEEQLFYPAVVDAQPEGEPIAEGFEEHSMARVALERCRRVLADDELFKVRIGVLQELVKHHIQEERNEILPRAKQAMPAEELERYGLEMQERFEKSKSGNPRLSLDRRTTERERQALHH